MRKFLRTALELVCAWFFPGSDLDQGPPGMYSVVWAEGWTGRRLVGKREWLASSTFLWESVQFLHACGADVLKNRGGVGIVVILAPEGFPIRQYEATPPAERAAAWIRATVPSDN